MSELPVAAAVPADGQKIAGAPKTERELNTERMRFVVLPPGKVDVSMTVERPLIDINLNAVTHVSAWNSDKLKETLVSANSMAFMPAGGTFNIQTENVLPGLLVEFDPQFWVDILEREFNLNANGLDFQDYNHDSVAADIGRAALTMMLNKEEAGEKTDRLVMESLAMALIGRTCNLVQSRQHDATNLGSNSRAARTRMQRVKDYVEAHLDEPLGLIELADVSCMSVSHFNRSFKQATGVSPLRYVFSRRVERAKDLLSKTDTPIAHVAIISGFAGQSHLTKVFKEHTGATPAAYRRSSLH